MAKRQSIEESLSELLEALVPAERDDKTPAATTESAGKTSSIFYWPDWYRFAPDGTLTVKATRYEDTPTTHTHASGVAIFAPSHADYPFWMWVIKKRRYADLIGEKELQQLRQEFVNHG